MYQTSFCDIVHSKSNIQHVLDQLLNWAAVVLCKKYTIL